MSKYYNSISLINGYKLRGPIDAYHKAAMMRNYFVTLLLCCVVLLPPNGYAEEANTGYIRGTMLTKDGGKMAGGKVYFFRDGSGPPPIRSKYWRTPDEIVEIGSDGRFIAPLAAGKYYISAIKKLSHDIIGPPEEGDWIYPDNRVDLRSEQKTYSVKKGEITDTGVIAEAVHYKKSTSMSSITAIEGTIVDSDGKPVAGAVAFAYLASDLIGKPLFVSERTGKDGKYLLRVSERGSYYIKVRTTLGGGQPKEGEIIGIHGKGMPEAVTVNTGEIVKGITITGKRFVKQYGNRPVNQ